MHVFKISLGRPVRSRHRGLFPLKRSNYPLLVCGRACVRMRACVSGWPRGVCVRTRVRTNVRVLVIVCEYATFAVPDLCFGAFVTVVGVTGCATKSKGVMILPA